MFKKIKKKMVHRKPSLCFQDSEGPRHSSMGITGVNTPVSLSLSKIQLYMIMVSY